MTMEKAAVSERHDWSLAEIEELLELPLVALLLLLRLLQLSTTRSRKMPNMFLP